MDGLHLPSDLGMSAKGLLSLFNYKAEVDRELLEAMIPHVDGSASGRVAPALRAPNHAHTVDCIFMAHLQNRGHGYKASWSGEAPTLADLTIAMRQTDQCYLDCLAELGCEDLQKEVGFTFADGGSGRISRQEMLAHVVTHSGYHRGEAGRLLPEIESTAMRDVFAGYLHRSKPQRRQ